MYRITEEILKLRGALDNTYKKGLEIFRRGGVVRIKSTEDLRFFQGKVQGSRLYDVEAEFDHHGKIQSTRCSCPAFRSYYGDCKHISALLVLIGKYKDPRENRENEMESFIEAYREQEVPEEEMLKLKVEMKLGEGISEFQFRIGEDMTYILKDIKGFIKDHDKEKKVYFGKKFTYDPKVHRFSKEDLEVLDFLKLLLDMQEDKGAESFYRDKDEVFQGKSLVLKNLALREFLKRLEKFKEGVTLWFEDQVYEKVRFSKEEMAMDFSVKELPKAGDLVLHKKSMDPLIPLDKKGDLVFYRGHFHNLQDPINQWIRPVIKNLKSQGEGAIRIPKGQAKSFITEVLPVLQHHSYCELEGGLDKKIRKLPLKAKLYLDQEQKKLVARLLFIYGDQEFNPFSPGEDECKGKTRAGEEKIFIREKKKEAHLLGLLEEGDFNVQKERCYIQEEEKIFYFLETLLPKLQGEENLSIYYSRDFKKVKALKKEDLQGKISLNHGLDLLECTLDIKHVPKKEIGDLLKSLREKEKYHRLANGTFLSLSGETPENIFAWMDEMELSPRDFEEGKLQIPKYKAFEIHSLQREKEESPFLMDDTFEDFLKEYQKISSRVNLKESLEQTLELPKGLKGDLRNYQKKGFEWISTLSDYGFGGILADEMGLGKTIQALSYLLKEKEKGVGEPSILVVPTSLVYNWEDEIKTFAPGLSVLTISGSKEEREEKIGGIKGFDLILTSYPLLRRDGELYEGIHFHACILDEAQHIKNKASQSAKAVKSLRGKHRFVLTGTPLENNLTELWSIFDFLIPGYLGSYKSFRENYQKPIGKNGDSHSLKRLKRKVEPFILRRLKSDVLKELPEKMEGKILVDMTQEQQKLYRLYLQRIKGELEEVIDEKGINKSQIQILAGLTRLRQISCHPGVFMEDYQGGSGKLEALGDILDQGLAANHRFLVFSQFTGVLKMVREELERKGHSPLYLDGSVPMNQRGGLVKKFNKGEVPIFLISLKAGGTGLNLTSADMVIHMDPWWNPAVENQATDRAHRMGQRKMVQVKKLIARGTVEEKIHKIQEQKKEIIDQIIQKGETMISTFSKEELLELLEG